MEEIWKDVVGYEGRYRISSAGRVFSLISKKYLSLKSLCCMRRGGYIFVSLHNGGKPKQMMVHRLVAAAFCEKLSPEHDQVNHKNFNKLDNRAQNLEWVTSKQNTHHFLSANPEWLRSKKFSSGDKHPLTKVSQKNKTLMWVMYRTGRYSKKDLSLFFGISEVQTKRIIKCERLKRNEKVISYSTGFHDPGFRRPRRRFAHG